jgi:hypothetical protein
VNLHRLTLGEGSPLTEVAAAEVIPRLIAHSGIASLATFSTRPFPQVTLGEPPGTRTPNLGMKSPSAISA